MQGLLQFQRLEPVDYNGCRGCRSPWQQGEEKAIAVNFVVLTMTMTRAVAALTAPLPIKENTMTVMITVRIDCDYDHNYNSGDNYDDALLG